MAFGLTNAPGVDGAELEQIRQTAENAVPKTTTVNGRPLTGDISLTPADVGAAPAGHSHTIFVTQSTAPSDRNVLWIDTTANTGGLKYFNGSAWVPVPVIYV
jgi:hypothetical protein